VKGEIVKLGQTFKTVVGYIWRVALCAFAYVVGTTAGGAIVSALGMELPSIPEQADEKTMGLCLLAGSFALAIAIGPLARRLRAAYLVRWLVLAALTYVCLGLNTPIEAAIFTSMGGMGTMPVFSILPCLLFAGVLALLFKPSEKAAGLGLNVCRFFAGRSAREWTWRFAAGICAFPAIYWIFGMMVAPWVLEYYKQGQFGLTLPGTGVIVLVQFLRSSLFFLASLGVLIVWSGSRLELTARLGLAFFVLVGLFGMIQSYWLWATVLVLHNLEILADSVVYAGVLAVLFVRKDASACRTSSDLAGMPAT